MSEDTSQAGRRLHKKTKQIVSNEKKGNKYEKKTYRCSSDASRAPFVDVGCYGIDGG
jgi:hypothetical protein